MALGDECATTHDRAGALEEEAFKRLDSERPSERAVAYAHACATLATSLRLGLIEAVLIEGTGD